MMEKQTKIMEIWLIILSVVVSVLLLVVFSLTMYTMSLSGWNDFQDTRIDVIETQIINYGD